MWRSWPGEPKLDAMPRSAEPAGVSDMSATFDYDENTMPLLWKPHRPVRPEKSEGGRPFKLVSAYDPAGDQPTAIAELCESALGGEKTQVLLGVTGSGKTFTMANVIARLGRPAIVFAPNKTLAAQLYSEFREFFPKNAVEYFVSYYDYYQPEAYVPQRDLFIEKDSAINEHIEQMRLSATKSVLERRDTIIVATAVAQQVHHGHRAQQRERHRHPPQHAHRPASEAPRDLLDPHRRLLDRRTHRADREWQEEDHVTEHEQRGLLVHRTEQADTDEHQRDRDHDARQRV
eukprot:gene18815-37894_t